MSDLQMYIGDYYGIGYVHVIKYVLLQHSW